MQQIYIIHENHDWTDPLKTELSARGLPHEDWFLHEGKLDLSQPPPEGVFYNRMSASSHTRDHRFAPEYAGVVLAWLESHGRRVLNSSRALQLELSKVAQYATLEEHGVRTPRTVAVIGRQDLLAAAEGFAGPFITKHNRAGKGLGVHLFQNTKELEAYVRSSEFEEPIDGITLIQQYIKSPEPFITRCEFVGGEFLYAVRVDTSDGFLLCPADECQDEGAFCPTLPASKFKIIQGFDDPIIDVYKHVLTSNSVHVAGSPEWRRSRTTSPQNLSATAGKYRKVAYRCKLYATLKRKYNLPVKARTNREVASRRIKPGAVNAVAFVEQIVESNREPPVLRVLFL